MPGGRRSPGSDPIPEAEPAGGSDRLRSGEVPGQGAPPQVTRPLGPLDVFEYCIARASNLLKVHALAHGRSGAPPRYLSDAHRAAIVLAVSALDAFIRTFVVARIGDLLVRRESLPELLSERIKKYLDTDGLLEAARREDLVDRVEKAFRADFEKRSFQGTRNIEEWMRVVGFKDVFNEVASHAKRNEAALRRDLDRFTDRRHAIAHRGDYDLTQQPPKEQQITKKEVEDCIKVVRIVAESIHAIGLTK